MTDRIDPPTDPTSRGLWPPVTDLTQIYDHGRDWCVNRNAHPDEHDGYPAPSHIPATECRTHEYFLDVATDTGTRLGGDRDDDASVGVGVGLSVYCSSAFRFGQARASAGPSAPRLIVETWTDSAEDADHSGRAPTPSRVALSLGEALKLARQIEHVVETVMFHA